VLLGGVACGISKYPTRLALHQFALQPCNLGPLKLRLPVPGMTRAKSVLTSFNYRSSWVVPIRPGPQKVDEYDFYSGRLSREGSALCIRTRSLRFSMPKSVNAMTPSSPTP